MSPSKQTRLDERKYIVWSPQGQTPPVVPLDTHKQAFRAANGMAKLHPGQDFYVMVTASKPVRVQEGESQANG